MHDRSWPASLSLHISFFPAQPVQGSRGSRLRGTQAVQERMRMNEVKRPRHKVKMDREILIRDMKSRWKMESTSRVKGVGLFGGVSSSVSSPSKQ